MAIFNAQQTPSFEESSGFVGHSFSPIYIYGPGDFGQGKLKAIVWAVVEEMRSPLSVFTV